MKSELELSDLDLGILEQFLATFGTEITPHARIELTKEEKDELIKLAAGVLDDERRKELVPLLMKNEIAIEFLAKEAG